MKVFHILGCLFLGIFCLSAQVPNEDAYIKSYHSDISINTDNSEIEVAETIEVKADGHQIQRGIFRVLPLYRDINGKNQRIKYDIHSVTRNGKSEPFHTEKKGNDFYIYIGSKDVLLTPDFYTYKIIYAADHQIGFATDFDELYWNVTGNDWKFYIEKVSVAVHLPNGTEVLQSACYTGKYGKKGSKYRAQVSGNTIFWESDSLNPSEGLTIAVGFTKGFVTPPPAPTFLEQFWALILSVLLLLWLFYYSYHKWQKYGIDPMNPTIIPQFYVPDDLSPAMIGKVDKNGQGESFISATIVDLAIKGFLIIGEKKEKKFLGLSQKLIYTLTKIKDSTEELPEEQRKFLEKFFSEGNEVTFDGSYDKKISKDIDSYESSVNKAKQKVIKVEKNSHLLWKPVCISLLFFAIGSVITNIQEGNSFTQLLFPGAFFIFGMLFSIMVYPLVCHKKWFRWFLFPLILIVIFFIFGSFVKIQEKEMVNQWVLIGFLLIFFVWAIYSAYLLRRPSEEYVKLQSEVEGFKMYLSTAEEHILQKMNPPEITPERFEHLLPYAIALGAEKVWGEKFQKLLQATGLENNYSVSWYSGNHFTPIYFTNTLSSSMNKTLGNSATAPSSKQGGSSFGSGGGGFSGGGGGGGGGGGW